jgi:hypothetical protein
MEPFSTWVQFQETCQPRIRQAGSVWPFQRSVLYSAAYFNPRNDEYDDGPLSIDAGMLIALIVAFISNVCFSA